MSRPIGNLSICAAAAVFLATAGVAEADSRLFGARSDQSGVTIVSAELNGSRLPVAGQGGSVTFFRIDNPGGAVPCANRIAFTLSSGAVATVDADICANGAQVSVPVASAAAPPQPPAAQPPTAQPAAPVVPAPAAPPTAAASSEPASGNETVTITIDDPNVTISAVFLGGKPVAISQTVPNGVEILVAPDPAGSIACSRDLGLMLSDGRRIARDVDICADNGDVVVQLVGGDSNGVAAAPEPSAPSNAGAQMQAPAAEGAVWSFSSTKDNGSLFFAVPNTDDSEFTAVCTPASSAATIALGRSAPEVRPGQPVTVAFAAGAFSQRYDATGSDVSQISGLSNPLISVKTNDPLWAAIIRESSLTVQIGSAAPYALSLSGSGAKARQFLSFCDPAPVFGGPPVSGPPVFADNGIPFACEDGERISVTFDDANNRVVVAQPGAPPLALGRVASRVGARYVGAGAELVGHAEDITWRPPGGPPSTCLPQR